jgi:hypothetical protein
MLYQLSYAGPNINNCSEWGWFEHFLEPANFTPWREKSGETGNLSAATQY